MQKILIIEDDRGIGSSLQIYLENSNFEVFLHDEGTKAVEKIREIDPDLIILDLNLPGKDGIEITKEFRNEHSTPIIMLTARSSEIDRIKGLEIGADDYIAKPFSPRELLARIHSILRRVEIHEKKEKHSLKYKNLHIDIEKQIVKKSGKNIALTANEYQILVKLIKENGAVLSRESIMKDIIGYDNYIYDRTVDTHIKNLRKKIGGSDYIITVRGAGYRIDL